MNLKCDVQSIYNNLCINENILKIYNDIKKYEDQTGGQAYHDLEHIKNVTLIVQRILEELKYNEEFIYKSKIACILHDIGAHEGKDNHAYKSYQFAQKYFKENNIEFEDMDLVLEAIKIHSDGFDTENIIALSLIFADKLDIKKTRISEEGKKAIGNRQYSHIEDISIKIKNQTLIINFVTDGKICLTEVNDYYFTKKVFKAIESFANEIGVKYKILLDDKNWNL